MIDSFWIQTGSAGNEFDALLIDDCSDSAFRIVLIDDESVVFIVEQCIRL